MFSLANHRFTVQLLDPAADARHLGARFCAGGFVWQVHDAGRPLFSGPEWPAVDPDPFNGQGLPESFRHRTLSGSPLTWRGPRGVAIGAGEIVAGADGAVVLVEPCRWTIRRGDEAIAFDTGHAALGFSYRLRRTVSLRASRLRSSTQLTNSASAPLAVEWFAHPFFTLPVDGLARAELPAGTGLAANPGFELSGNTLRQKRRFVSRDDGHFDHVHLPAGKPLATRVAHPTLGAITLVTRFVPASCALWGNDRTFSVEPYLGFELAPGETRAWSVEYRLGA